MQKTAEVAAKRWRGHRREKKNHNSVTPQRQWERGGPKKKGHAPGVKLVPEQKNEPKKWNQPSHDEKHEDQAGVEENGTGW